MPHSRHEILLQLASIGGITSDFASLPLLLVLLSISISDGTSFSSDSISLEVSSVANATCGICGSRYTAGIGETLESIAAHCQVSLLDAATANRVIDPRPSANLTGMPLEIPCNHSSRCGICGASYTIQEHDILFDVARSCGMDLDVLEMANPDIDYENVYPGQIIRVPCLDPNASIAITGCGDCGIYYIAATNKEPLANVSASCGVSIEDIVLVNHLSANATLIQGQRLRIPCNVNNNWSCGPCGSSFTVLRGDRRAVPAKCRVGLIALQESNPSTDLDHLKPGQRVKIPCKHRQQQQEPGKCSRHLCDTTIVVKNTSSVLEVAKLCNVTPELVSYANGIPVTAAVYPGQSLAVPCEDSPVPLQSCSICGSSVAPSVAVDLATVARVCGVTVTDIQRATETNLRDVAFGDVLRIPCGDKPAGCGPCGVAYKALDSDTLASIAVKCSTFISDIQAANPALNFSDSISGRKLVSLPCRLSRTSSGLFMSKFPRKLIPVLLVIFILHL